MANICDKCSHKIVCKYKGTCDECNQFAEDKWISVKDRLPESAEKVLAVVKSVCGKGNPYIQLVWYGTKGFHISDPDFGYLNMNRYVTHWMPLPEPAKGE